jgi:diguanylate cyclase
MSLKPRPGSHAAPSETRAGRPTPQQEKARLPLAEHHFRTTFDESPIGMCLIDCDDKFLMANRAFCEIVGYRSETLRRMTFHDLTHPDDLDGDLSLREALMAGEIASYQFEKRYYHRRGPIRWVNVSVSLVRDSAR